MSTLTEFLKARITADERAALSIDAQRTHRCCNPMAGMCEVYVLLEPGRMLAECAAKRQIIELHDGDHECASGQLDALIVGTGWHTIDPTLKLLALAYAEHPDYREEWRP
jgi:hypothetical protein